MNVIETAGLSKSYGRKRVVEALDLTVRRGEIYGFVGRNGAGKSTVMKMLAGLAIPTEGRISMFGEPLAPGSASRRVGALIESPGVLPGSQWVRQRDVPSSLARRGGCEARKF